MSDSIHQSLRGLSLQNGDNVDRRSQQYTTPPRQSASSFGSGSLRSSTDVPPQPFFVAPSDVSAAARFERFFPTSPGATSTQHAGGLTPSNSNPGLGPSSAFGSFGRNLAPGSVGSMGSGHFGSSSGVRKTSSRAAIPTQWSAQDPALSSPANASPPKHSSHYSAQDLNGGGGGGAAGLDDDVIPTAIVVKNIPFSVKREQLLQIIEDLACPMPYAFNYHCDQGVFRGLAFANFKDPAEADQVVAALNGFDVSGRKLRVEYKKVLQAGEKERIEKEKAIKRMHSMQLEKDRERERVRQQDEYVSHAYLMPGYPGQFATPDSYVAASTGQQAYEGMQTAAGLRNVPSSSRLNATSDQPTAKREELDLNDASTLEIYSRVLLFRDDRMRDELSFSRSLTPLERRTVHLVAQKLGLYHYSSGEGDDRCVVVTKSEGAAQTRSLRSQASSIGRTQRGPAADMLSPGSAATTGRAGLRTKKSAPDMLYDPQDDASHAAGYLNPLTGSLTGRKSNSNLREGYSATMGRRPQPGGIGGAAGLQSLFASPFDVPPVPSLSSSTFGSQGVDAASHSSPSQYSNLLRQPRGPPTPGASVDTRNFAVRSRVSTARLGRTSPTPSPNQNTKAPDSLTQSDSRYFLPSLTDSDVTTHSTLEI